MAFGRLRMWAVPALALLIATSCAGADGGDGGSAAETTVAAPTTSESPGPLLVDDAEREASTGPDASGVASDDPDRAVLTGLTVEDPGVLSRPALAVKIDNVDSARPQAGLIEADLVYEELVEGGLTRFLAIYHSTDPASVGPVRSARSTDVPLLMPLTMPLFAWSGANAAFAELLDITAVFDVGVDRRPEAYRRRSDRDAPSNLFSTPEMLRGFTPDTALSPRPMFTFLPEDVRRVSGSRDVTGVEVDWGATQVTFRWNEAAQGWTRTQDGRPHLDDAGVLVAPENLVIQIVPYVNTDAVDGNGAPVPEAQIASGQGAAWMMSGGGLVEGTWFKDNVTVASQYRDSQGTVIPLARGRTWVLLVPEGAATLVE